MNSTQRRSADYSDEWNAGDPVALHDIQNRNLVLGEREFVRGNGAKLHTSRGEEFIDLNNNASLPLGHDAGFIRSVFEEDFPLNAGLYSNRYRRALIETLQEIFPEYSGFQFYCSGTAANEGMLRYAMEITGRSSFCGFSGTYYGRSKATVSLADMESSNGRRIEGYHQFPFPGHDPVSDGFSTGADGAIHPTVEEMEEMIDRIGADDIAGVVIEPYLSKRMIALPQGWLKRFKQNVLDPRGILLLADEYLVAGRAGAWQICRSQGAEPDMFTFGKCFTNGIPFGGVAALRKYSSRIVNIWGGDTYGGQPAVCRMVLGTIAAIRNEHLIERQEEISRLFLTMFSHLGMAHSVSRVCAAGGLLGIELISPAIALKVGRECFERGVLVTVVRRIVRMTPALNIDRDLLNDALLKVLAVIQTQRETEETAPMLSPEPGRL